MIKINVAPKKEVKNISNIIKIQTNNKITINQRSVNQVKQLNTSPITSQTVIKPSSPRSPKININKSPLHASSTNPNPANQNITNGLTTSTISKKERERIYLNSKINVPQQKSSRINESRNISAIREINPSIIQKSRVLD